MLAETLETLSGFHYRDQNGEHRTLQLLPPATESEIESLEKRLPCPLPNDLRHALRVSKGFAKGPLESFSLLDLEGFGLEELLPCAYSVAHDGSGNYWVLDLGPRSSAPSPVFYACHDPAVLAYQAASIEEFVLAMLPPADSKGAPTPVAVVHDDVVHRIWRTNPGLVTAAAAAASGDEDLRAFAATLPSTALVADLRHARIGDGVSWGRFGPRTVIRRAPEHQRIWAVMPEARRPGVLSRLFGTHDEGA